MKSEPAVARLMENDDTEEGEILPRIAFNVPGISRVTNAAEFEATVIDEYETRIKAKKQERRKKHLQSLIKGLSKEVHFLEGRPPHRRTALDDKELQDLRGRLKIAEAELQELEPVAADKYSTATAAEGSSSFYPFLSGEQIVPKSQQYFPSRPSHKRPIHVSSFGEKTGKLRNQEAPLDGESQSGDVDRSTPTSASSTSKSSQGTLLDDIENELLQPSRAETSSSFLDDGIDEIYVKRIQRWLMQLGCEFDVESLPSTEAYIGKALREMERTEVTENFCVPLELYERLFPHQKEALTFLWRLHQAKTGGMIGDEMGLGKTLSMAGFLAGLHFTDRVNSENALLPHGVLIIAPATVVRQWAIETQTWYAPIRCWTLGSRGPTEQRDIATAASASAGNFLIISYEAMRQSIMRSGHPLPITVDHQTWLRDLHWSYVILDEGQKIRNPSAAVTVAAKQLPTAHRILLSGSPIQNNLRELWSLFDFIVPGRLGTLPSFMERFAEPIRRGGLANASRENVLAGYHCAVALREVIKPHMLRRSKSAVQEFVQLPGKEEHVLFCHLSPAQFQIYIDFLKSCDVHARSFRGDRKQRSPELRNSRLFFALSVLRKICNHPDLLLLAQSAPLVDDYGNENRSGKLCAMIAILERWKKEGHRALVFSQTVQMLNIIEALTEKRNLNCRRIDGSTSVPRRHVLIEEFNKDSSIFALLLTTRVGGVGLNLTAANRVLIFDPDWNPMTDVQARERSWRIGQQKDVLIFRLILGGTLEEKIYQRQIYKQFLSIKILDAPHQKRFFKWNDVKELFQVPPCPPVLENPDVLSKITPEYAALIRKAIGRLEKTTLDQTQSDDTDTSDPKSAWQKELIGKDAAGKNNPPTFESQSKLASQYSAITNEERIPRRKIKVTTDVIPLDEFDRPPAFKKTKVSESRSTHPETIRTSGKEHVTDSNRNPLIENLLNWDVDLLQGSLLHDDFERSDPDFDLAKRRALEQSAAALQAINGTSAVVEHSLSDSNEPIASNEVVDVMALLRRRAAL